MCVTYRALTAQDAFDYRQLRLQSLQQAPTCYGATYAEQVALPTLYVESLLEEGSDVVIMLGAFIQAELIALCGLKANDDNQREIIQMYVAPKARGKAVAQSLLHLAKQMCKARAANGLILTVYKDNRAAIASYQKAAFNVLNSQGKEITMAFQVV